jgi:hypothetical protein
MINTFTPRVSIGSSDCCNVSTTTTSSTSDRSSSFESNNFLPGPYDVICARGTDAFNAPGNKYFRKLVQEAIPRYAKATTKAQRSWIVSDIVHTIRSLGNGFVKPESDGSWSEVGDTLAREKCGQLFRSSKILSNKYRSSTASKRKRRDETSSKFHQALHNIVHCNKAIKDTTESMKQTALEQFKTNQMSDDEIVGMFTSRNSFLLEEVIKQDQALVNTFEDAYATGCSSEDEDQ